MTTTPNDDTVAAETAEEDAAHVADRAATPDEAAAAERLAADVDLDEVARHEQEMGKIGAEVRGEGQIVDD